ncbi:MAG: sulfatase, partial [Acidobacteriota bacterium]
LSLDGHDLGTIELTTTLEAHTVALPADLQHRGVHRLEIRHGAPTDARQPHKDLRSLWFEIVVSDMPPSPPGVDADVEAGTLSLAVGTRVDYYLDLPTAAVWAADRVIPRQDARLDISWHPLDGEGRTVASLGRDSDVHRTIDGSGPGRLSIEVTGPDHSAITLVQPRLIGAPTAPTAEAPSVAEAPPVGAPPTERPPIFLYMIDTLRADHLGVYGYQRDTSPNIDRFADEAVVFENAYSQSSWTRASIASALTGLLPPAHGAVDETDILPDSVTTLAERLREVGYRNGAVVANGNVSDQLGFPQGFDHYDYLVRTRDGFLARSQTVHEHAFTWVDEQPTSSAPLFLWTLTIDPHAPYAAPEPFHSRFSDQPLDPEAGAVLRLHELAVQEAAVDPEAVRHLRDLYDAEVAHNDATFADFLDELRARELYDRSIIVLLADHGEEFYDHASFEHGRTLYAEQLRTPLIIKLPGSSVVGRRQQPVQQVDLLPTLLELAGVPIATDSPLHGRSLVPLLTDDAADGTWQRLLVKHLDLRQHNILAATDGRYRVILPRRHGWDHFPRLYDAVADPKEQRDLAAERPELARYLVAEMQRELATVESIERQQVNLDDFERTQEQLRALGYIK